MLVACLLSNAVYHFIFATYNASTNSQRTACPVSLRVILVSFLQQTTVLDSWIMSSLVFLCVCVTFLSFLFLSFYFIQPIDCL